MDHHLFESALSLLVTGFGVALIGGWHCAAMCGSISALNRDRKALVYYQAGRLLSYLAWGVGASFFGQSILALLAPAQAWFFDVLMVILILWLLLTRTGIGNLHFFGRLSKQVWKWRNQIPFLNPSFSLGILNGFLPCHWLLGFVLMAATLKVPWAGAVLLFSLWLGSTPWLFGGGLFLRNGFYLKKVEKYRGALLIFFLIFGILGRQIPWQGLSTGHPVFCGGPAVR